VPGRSEAKLTAPWNQGRRVAPAFFLAPATFTIQFQAMLSDWDIAVRLLLAAGLGSLIGAERERLAWTAGLRTHMLVSVGACLFMQVSSFGFADIINEPHVILDPSRVAAQVVSGIGFLGAGSILLRGDVVKGLTTAASLWTVAAIGLAVGGGLYAAALVATVIILVILAGIKPLENWLQGRNTSEIVIKATPGSVSLETISQTLGWYARRITRYIAVPAGQEGEEIRVTLSRVAPAQVNELIARLAALSGVREVS
jgi:putative Mg2+ transporter-C (MgtC) family protein